MDHRSSFVDRHIGPNQYQVQTMLLELGFKDLDSFIKSVVPAWAEYQARKNPQKGGVVLYIPGEYA